MPTAELYSALSMNETLIYSDKKFSFNLPKYIHIFLSLCEFVFVLLLSAIVLV